LQPTPLINHQAVTNIQFTTAQPTQITHQLMAAGLLQKILMSCIGGAQRHNGMQTFRHARHVAFDTFSNSSMLYVLQYWQSVVHTSELDYYFIV